MTTSVHIKIAHEHHHPLLQLRHNPPNMVVEIRRMITKTNDKRRNRKLAKKVHKMQKAAPTTFSAQRQPNIRSGECRTQEHGKIG
jgi:hypothetical protein